MDNITNILEILPVVCVVFSILLVLTLKVIRVRQNAVLILTIGVYTALSVLFFWGNAESNIIADAHVLLNAIIQSILEAAKVFTLNAEFTDAENLIMQTIWIPQAIYSNIVAIMFVVAPILTIGNILYLFRGGFDYVRFQLTGVSLGTRYVFSEINSRSLAMAQSVKINPLLDSIVFTNCGALNQENENEKEFIEKAYDINAICLKRDLAHVYLWKLFGKNEIFIISENEQENVSQTIDAILRYKDKKISNAIYAYVASEHGMEAIDSVEKGDNLLSRELREQIEKEPSSIFKPEMWRGKNLTLEGHFSVRCVNPVEQTVRNVIKNSYSEVREKSKKAKKTITVIIVGLGRYGMQFLKNAAWMYQLKGYDLKIYVIDVDEQTKERLEYECPELCSKGKGNIEGDASHDIYVHTGIDSQCSKFDSLIQDKNLKDTQIIFVDQDEDAKNIKTAMRIRRLFLPEAEPLIYAVVSDAKMANNLKKVNKNGLNNYKKQVYNIHFVGDWEYSYKDIDDIKENELYAFQHHISWMKKDIGVENDSVEAIRKKAEEYAQFSYYRNSSVAMELHRKLLRNIPEKMTEQDKWITEHMRWNAYMRGEGFRYGNAKEKTELAKLHKDLIPYGDLPEEEKEKDIMDFELLFEEVKIKCTILDQLKQRVLNYRKN